MTILTGIVSDNFKEMNFNVNSQNINQIYPFLEVADSSSNEYHVWPRLSEQYNHLTWA